MKKTLIRLAIVLLAGLAFTLPGAPPALAQPPPNDDFDSAIVVDSLPFTDNQWTGEATWAEDDPSECHNNGSVWYTFTPPEDIVIEANTYGSGYDTTLAAYTGVRGALSLVPGACNDDYNGLQSRVVFAATAGTNYHFLVGYCCGTGSSGGGGDLVFNVLEREPPVNDDWANATPIALPLPFEETVNTEFATMEESEPLPPCAQAYSPGRTVWYALTPEEDGWARPRTETWFGTFSAAYTGSALDGMTLVQEQCGMPSRFHVTAGTTYYIQVGGLWGDGGDLTFRLEAGQPPANDDFLNATLVPELPFNDVNNTEWAGMEPEEPIPSCVGGEAGKTIWYAFTPVESVFVAVRLDHSFSPVMAAYTGSSLAALTEVGCKTWGEWLMLHAEAGTTYYFQVGGMWSEGGPMTFYLDLPPPPQAGFDFGPGDPSAFDTLWFWDWSWDPAGVGIASQAWDFGDGTMGEGCCPAHRYAADGDYTVQLTVTTADGRSASTSRAIAVRTHDVAVIKFVVPKAAAVGQTRPIVVGLNSRRYPERVEVQLFKSIPGGYEWVGSLVQSVPVRPANRTTDFSFKYTFTADDANMGKVTFRAMANLIEARDALPADNEAIAMRTKVTR